jgi:hypothetical protein
MKFDKALLYLHLIPAGAKPNRASGPDMAVSKNGRYLVKEDGKRFLLAGRYRMGAFHRLNREKPNIICNSVARRASRSFKPSFWPNLMGLSQPNPYGQVPLIDNDPTKPNEDYFKQVDYIVNKAEELSLYIAMLPTWGDKFNKKWGVGPEIFTPENARTFGEFLGKRYRNKPIVWILGGDRIPEEEADYAIIRAMAAGLQQGDQGRHLMSYHPQGGYCSADFFHGDDWLDFNMFQSGHGEINKPNYRTTFEVSQKQPTKPVLDGEPNYEDHPINWQPANGWFDEFDSRRAGYWSMLAGAMGHTYGNHNVWQFLQPSRPAISSARTPWKQALTYPGAYQAGYMRALFESRPWWLLKSDQSLLRSGPNTGGKEIRVALAADGSLAMAYSPFGSSFVLSLSGMASNQLHAWWFNPRDGTHIDVGVIKAAAEIVFDPPGDEKRGNDWMLVIDLDLALPPPGVKKQ